MKSLYLVDASAMFYRAFFALPPMTNSSGMQTNALYGFMSMTIKLLRECRPDYIVYCFDRKEPSFRSELFKEYKANREEMPDALIPQIPYMRKLTDALGLMDLDKEGFEADDVIGSLTHMGLSRGLEVTIVSGDKDFSQLVRAGVTLFDTMKDVRLDSAGVRAKWGVDPDQMIDYLAIVGDTSDNIPGVKGVGPKGAVKLLEQFKTLDAVYENVEKIPAAGVRSKMAESRDSAFLARRLVTIVTDLDLGLDLENSRPRPFDHEKLRALLQELQFKSFEKSLLQQAETPAPSPSAPPASTAPAAAATKIPARRTKGAVEFEDWEADLEEIRKRIEPYTEITGVWTEMGAIVAWRGRVVRTAASPKDLGALLASKRLRWRGWDLKEVFKNLQASGETVDWDGRVAAYVLRPDKMGTFEEIYESRCGNGLPPMASPVQLMNAHAQLEKALETEIKAMDSEKVFVEMDLPLIPVLAKMELHGIRIDKDELARQSQVLADDLKRLEKSVHEAAGGSFNIASPKQLADVLFVRLGLPPKRKTKTGFSTDSDVLQALDHPIAKLILEYRELSKLKSTYVDSLPSLADSESRLHTELNQTLTSTGRLSSSNPNLQNIPIRTARGREVRKAFIPESGDVLISADYSQIELRVLAHFSQDEAMIAAFKDDLDIHTATAAEIFGVGIETVNVEQRRAAKAVNFGIAYGQGAFGLAEGLGIPRNEAAAIIERYFNRFPGVKLFMEETVRTAMERGYVETLFGRRRYIEELKSHNPMFRKAGERAAINAPIQGTAADLVKLAMIKLNQSLPIPLLLQVHDELLFECPKDEVEENATEIRSVMEMIVPLRVPLKVNVATGKNWEEAHG